MPLPEEKLPQKCQSIFLNLLATGNEKFNDADASAYVREFFQTERCDKVFDLSKERKSLEEFVGVESAEKILEYKDKEKISDGRIEQ